MIVHAADAHLGITRYSKIDPQSGQNLRGKDFLDSFVRLCEDVISIRPDLFLFCGDLFDRVNPTNHVRRVVQQKLMEISEKSIETIILSGNHETPRSRGVSNPLILYKDIPHMNIVLSPSTFDFGPYHIRAVPFTAHPHTHMGEPEKGKTNILMLHTTLEGAKVGSERYMCFSDETISRGEIPPYDYVALGHIHKAQDLSTQSSRILYSGSLERYDFNEMHERKGYYIIDGDPEFVELPTRSMNSSIIDVTSMNGYDITRRCIEIIEKIEVEDALYRIELVGELENIERNSINFSSIRNIAQNAAHFSILDRTLSSRHDPIREGEVLFSPYVELERYLKMSGQSSDSILDRGSTIIERRIGT